MKIFPCLLIFLSFNVFADQQFFSCRMGNSKMSKEVHIRGAVDSDGGNGVIKIVTTENKEVTTKRYEVSGILTFFSSGEVTSVPFTHMRLQPRGVSEVLYFNFLVGFPEIGSSHFVMDDNTLFRGKCLSL